MASSFFNNLELTDEEAQKGPAILRYIESLGYKKEDVMVLGDSLNDLSYVPGRIWRGGCHGERP